MLLTFVASRQLTQFLSFTILSERYRSWLRSSWSRINCWHRSNSICNVSLGHGICMRLLILKWRTSCNILSSSRLTLSRKTRWSILCVVYIWHMSHIWGILVLWMIEKVCMIYDCLLVRSWWSRIFAHITIYHLVTSIWCSNQDSSLIWDFSTLLTIVEPR